ncbi:DUF3253 domain-containing protein [Thalassococcus arenae]|uniref:DUF3253 domain-containing protein n=1 Tax=Thalassococcus arenae TaxID=2851652 RepID=UPI0020CB37B3|nr:DUF3253 domain-containing protein [Thalassococcus arenae]
MDPSDDAIAAELMRLAQARGTGKSFCPSEVARALANDWRPLMPRIREIAAQVPLQATQRGKPVDPVKARGPIRLRLVENVTE